METQTQPQAVSKKIWWTSWVISAIPILMLVWSAVMKLMKPPEVVNGFRELGYSEAVIVPIAVTELACAVIYAIPRTAVFGAVLVAAYLGGAVNTHVRAGQPFYAAVILGVMAWIGLYLRDPRLRELVPFGK